MSFEWSFSGERSFNRCQRQFFIREFVVSHSAKDPVRREYFVLKQLTSLDQWHGLLLHRGIEKMVVSALSATICSARLRATPTKRRLSTEMTNR